MERSSQSTEKNKQNKKPVVPPLKKPNLLLFPSNFLFIYLFIVLFSSCKIRASYKIKFLEEYGISCLRNTVPLAIVGIQTATENE